ncbi:MAG: hypothetical protein H6816_12835 [Phycisphaerales bacterium]|nr:hypothetical protein [Phycisphaerales bacterium]
MSRRLWACFLALCCVVVAGCHDQEPPEAYNRDLSENSGQPLLPVTTAYHPAHNPDVNKGNTRATIVKLSDFDSGAPMPELPSTATTAAAATPQLPPADSVAGALSNVGAAFLGNLAGGGKPAPTTTPGTGMAAGPATAEQPAATGTAAGSPSAAATGAQLSTADKETLYTLVERYGGERKERAFIDLPDLVVVEQHDTAMDYYDKLAELNAVLTNLLTVFEDNTPGIKAEYEAKLAETLVAYELTNPAAQDATTATATLIPVGGGTPVNVTFLQESGYWRIKDPFVPAADQWEKVSGSLDGAIQALNAIDNDLLDGQKVDASRARDAFSRAVTLLGGGS